MVVESWSLTAGKLCESCKTTSARVFCKADSAYLCMSCDSKIHVANKLASRHARVWMCEVCEQAPATVTCKADSATLCATCDLDIHSANPLAQRHERSPVIPFYDSARVAAESHSGGSTVGGEVREEKCLNDKNNETEDEDEDGAGAGPEAAATTVASWLLPNDDNYTNNNAKGFDIETSAEYYLFNDMDINVSYDEKPHIFQHHQHYNNSSDGVVPVRNKINNDDHGHAYLPAPVVDGFPTYEVDFNGSKPFLYNFSSQFISQSVSSSSLDVGVVPDYNSSMADVSNTFSRNDTVPNPASGLDREARVLRYREKRKNRKFEKTIRYASRKAYAETRPRIKGRFVKRTEIDSLITADASYGVVPSF